MPLIYTSNQELIDHHIKNAQDVITAQTEQLRQVAGTHTAKATEVTKQYMGDYTAKAQQLLKGNKATSPQASTSASAPTPAQSEPVSSVRDTDFPAAPKEDIKESVHVPEPAVKHNAEEEPLIAA